MNDRSRPTTERELVDAIIRGAAEIWPGAEYNREVRLHGRARTDVVVSCRDEVVAIEAKLYHWQRAIGQAVLNRYFADRSYVAMWAERITQAIQSEASAYGVGLLAVRETGVEVIKEAPTARTNYLITRQGSLARETLTP
jgi:hypothetical protein